MGEIRAGTPEQPTFRCARGLRKPVGEPSSTGESREPDEGPARWIGSPIRRGSSGNDNNKQQTTTTTTTTITTTTKMSFTSIMSLFYNSFTGFWCQFSGGIPLRHFLSEFWRWEVSNPSIWSRLWCDRTIWIWNRRLNLQFVHIFQSLFLRGRDLACHLIMFWPKQSCALLDKSQVRSHDKAVKSTSKWCQR